MLIQEHNLPLHSLDEATAWCRRNDWKPIWEPAQQLETGRFSAGVAILARDFLGLSEVPADLGGSSVVSHRVVAAVLRPPKSRQVVLYSAYLYDSEQLSVRNTDVLTSLGMHLTKQSQQHIIGADWNMSSDVLAGSNITEAANSALVVPPKGQASYTSGGKRSLIDYFLVQKTLSKAIGTIAVDVSAPMAPHKTCHPHFQAQDDPAQVPRLPGAPSHP